MIHVGMTLGAPVSQLQPFLVGEEVWGERWAAKREPVVTPQVQSSDSRLVYPTMPNLPLQSIAR